MMLEYFTKAWPYMERSLEGSPASVEHGPRCTPGLLSGYLSGLSVGAEESSQFIFVSLSS
eukprot:CAMPEP_0179056236 /NCGR_PEP_ID=MMETSP0796-20121207/23709_1 /TAXON_ID=73915 /ORGANISM="Pyrodinium bahamense, Strain pbaha01" /LENGTH=59 /DNA_ID=CAMNT_0020752907 /DNA_START=20 /DNA_END=195 /DNA_ORIENTATION=-